jgi:hypothetical protein
MALQMKDDQAPLHRVLAAHEYRCRASLTNERNAPRFRFYRGGRERGLRRDGRRTGEEPVLAGAPRTGRG